MKNLITSLALMLFLCSSFVSTFTNSLDLDGYYFEEEGLSDLEKIKVLGSSISYFKLALDNDSKGLINDSLKYKARHTDRVASLKALSKFIIDHGIATNFLDIALEMKDKLLDSFVADRVVYGGLITGSMDDAVMANSLLDKSIWGLYILQKRSLNDSSFDYKSYKDVKDFLDNDLTNRENLWEHSRGYEKDSILYVKSLYLSKDVLEDKILLVLTRQVKSLMAETYTEELKTSYDKKIKVMNEMKNLQSAWLRYASLNVDMNNLNIWTIRDYALDFAENAYSTNMLTKDQVFESVVLSWRANISIKKSWMNLNLLSDSDLELSSVYERNISFIEKGLVIDRSTGAALSPMNSFNPLFVRLSSQFKAVSLKIQQLILRI